MRITITEPASKHPRLPEPGGRVWLMAPVRFMYLKVVSVEPHGDEVTFVLELPHAEVWIKGEPVNPVWADWAPQPVPEPAGYVDGLPFWDTGNAPGEAAA